MAKDPRDNIGRHAYWCLADVEVLVRISDVKSAYGRVRYKVEGLTLSDCITARVRSDKWVDADKLAITIDTD